MAKPRVIIADEDMNYIIPLQLKFVKEFFDQIDLEIITDREYFDETFSRPQKADVFIVSDEFYEPSLQKHNIANIFVMVEQYEEGGTEDLNINKMFKYTSIKEIFNEIVSKSEDALNMGKQQKKETQIVVVTSASGGVGKTTVAMGISACLTKNYKRVLYIDASRLQGFQYMLDNQAAITASDVYTKLTSPARTIYSDIKHAVRNEVFSYLPPFKASLMSLGLDFSIYEKIAASAKESSEYDYIIIDAEDSFDERLTKLLDIADRVIIVTDQTMKSVVYTNRFVSNINGINSDKYAFVCNNFDQEKVNALIRPDIILKFNVSDYVEHISDFDNKRISDYVNEPGIQKTTFLVL